MKRLLVCTDGSNYSQECCRYAAWLARETGASVTALYVSDLRQFEVPAFADLSGSLGIQPFEGMVAQLRDVEAHKANFVKESALKVFDEAGLGERTEFVHETGLLVDVIDRFSEDVDVILLGKRGENANFAAKHLGSMLERVVRASKKPCLVTPRAYAPVERIAIAYDGGESSQKAIEFIMSDALLKSLHLHVITVAEINKEDTAAERLKEAETLLQSEGLSPVFQVLAGDVETAISHYVTQEKIDLLVAGAYGHSRIRELLIGSTTTQLLRDCHVPLLCFR